MTIKKNKPKLRHHIIISFLLATILSIGLIGFFWVHGEYANFQSESKEMRKRFLISYEDLLKTEVGTALSYIEYQKTRVEPRLRQSIEGRVNEAYAIASSIFNHYRDKRTMAEMQEMVKEALRPIRFNEDRGYYFAFNLQGIDELLADRPEMEGKDVLPVQGEKGEYVVRDMLDLVKSHGQGFYQYTWTKPKKEGLFPKIAYIKLFEPFGWVIGSGEYLDDVERDVQEEVIEFVEKIHFEQDGYVFVTQWDGVSLTTPAKGKNMWEITDSNGTKIVQEMIRLAKQGSGYLKYVMPKLGGTKPAPKLSYVVGIPEWKWYVGTGIYIDKIETAIGQKEKEVEQNIIGNLAKIALVLAGITGFICLAAFYVSRKTKINLDAFTAFFERASSGLVEINLDEMNYSELLDLAHSANNMMKARKKAEQELVRAHAVLHTILEKSPFGVALIGMDRKIRWVNRYASELAGEIEAAALCGKECVEYLCPASQNECPILDKHQVIDNSERLLRRQDGVEIPILKTVIEIEMNGEPVFLETFVDITESKKAEEALLAKTLTLETVFQSAPYIMMLVNTELRVTDINRKGIQFTGKSKDELLGLLCGQVYECSNSHDGRGCGQNDVCEFCPVRSQVMHTFDTGEQAYEKSGRLSVISDGTSVILNILISTSLVQTTEGRQVLVTISDITGRVQAEEKLRESESRLAKSQEIAHVGIWELDKSGNRMVWSDEIYRIFGLKPQMFAATYEAFLNAVHPEDRALVDTAYSDSIHEGRDGYGIEHRVVRNLTGEIRYVQEKCENVKGISDRIVRSFGIVQDITERKQAEMEKDKLQDRLLQAQKMEAIGSLAGGIAHDLNNILFPISGFSEMLLDEFPSDSHVHESIDQIYKSAKRGSDLVNQILAFSRQSNLQKLPIRIQPILKEVLKLVRATIPKNIELTSHIEKDCGRVLADPTKIHQVAMNLITNAYHAVEEKGGSINIELKETEFGRDDLHDNVIKPGKYVVLSVSDTGTGIDQTMIDKIFDPYFTTKEQGKGTGLGLSVVHGIVKEHGGDVHVESQAGEGTTFKVYLPLDKNTNDNKSATVVREYPTGTENILLVDDEAPIAKMVQMMLERLGYKVTTRTSSPDALDAFKANPSKFDLVISDRGMPNMTGEQLARELILIKPEIPIILCTGFSDENDEQRAREIGIKGFLMKPVATGDLATTVRNLLDKIAKSLKVPESVKVDINPAVESKPLGI